MNIKEIMDRIKKRNPNQAAYLAGAEHARKALEENHKFSEKNEFKNNLISYGILLKKLEKAPTDKKETIKRKMAVLELLLDDSESAYLAGAYRVLQAAGEKEECKDVANVLLFFLKNHILSYLKKNIKPSNAKEDWLAEIGAQLQTMLLLYRPIHNATLPSYSHFYFIKAREMVATEPEEYDVFDTNDEYLETITKNKKNKVKNSYEAEGKKLVKKKVVLSFKEAARGNRALAELLGMDYFDEE